MPAVLALPLAHFFSPRRRPLAWLIEGRAVVLLGPVLAYFAVLSLSYDGGWGRYLLSAKDLGSAPRHTRISQSETPAADVRSGLEAARALGVDYVVISAFGSAGPAIKVYRLR